MDVNTGPEQESRYTAARFNEKGCFKDWGGDALRMPHDVLHPKTLGFSLWFYSSPGSPDQGKLIPTLGSW